MMRARCVRYSTARSLSTRRSMRWRMWNRGARRARSSSSCRSQARDDKRLRPKGWSGVEVDMRKLIAGMKISVEGKIEGPEGYADWVEAWSDDYDLMLQVDACLLGG